MKPMVSQIAIFLTKIKKNKIKLMPKKAVLFAKKAALYRIKAAWRTKHPYALSDDAFRKKVGDSFPIKWFFNEQQLPIIKKKFNAKQKKQVLRHAEYICKHKFDLLGSGMISLGKDINWHRDFKSGRVWPVKHYALLDYESVTDNSDVKVVWDLNRMHHLALLGEAYALTGDKKYALEFSNQFSSWQKNNQFEFGVNWICPMEAAIRAINLMFCHFFFRDCKEIEDSFWVSYLKLVFLHGKFINENIEWSVAPENHYLTDALGLFVIGMLFTDSKPGKKWMKKGKNMLEKEIRRQVGNDGVDYEASINYHRLVTEIFLLAYILGERNGVSFSAVFREKLEKMLDFIDAYTKLNGLAPVIGDMDDGRIVPFWNENLNDHRDLLACGSVLFRKNYQHNYHSDLQWIIGNAIPKAAAKQASSIAFPQGGYYAMRSPDVFMIIRCGDIGRKGIGGHGHNDALSFELNCRGKDIFVDPGSFVYTADTKLRHLFRSTAYHNTLVVNGKEMNGIKWFAPFNMDNDAKPKCIKWESNTEKDSFIGWHSGFSPFIAQRSIEFDKPAQRFVIKDNVKNGKLPEINLNLHLAHGLKTVIKDNSLFIGKNVKLSWKNFSAPKIKKGFVSPSYGIKHNASIISFRNEPGKMDFELVIELI